MVYVRSSPARDRDQKPRVKCLVKVLFMTVTLQALHVCLPPGELRSPGHCIHSMDHEHKYTKNKCAREGRGEWW